MTTITQQVETGATKYRIEPGRAHPLGVVPDEQGVNSYPEVRH